MSIGAVLNQIDEALASLVGQWNAYSTAIVTLAALIVSYALTTQAEPDTYPILLARQARASDVRQQGHSPVYRGSSAPHGTPLNTGLNVKEAGASKWSQGRDGDLRDVWRRAVSGSPDDEGPKATGKILTVLGSARVVESKPESVTRQINLIGQHISSQGGSKVAIYLPNSVEFLAALFACSFYNLTAVLVPFASPEEAIISRLQRSGADTVITVPGALSFDGVVKGCPGLKQLVWVTDDGNKNLDWNEVAEGTGGRVNVSTWQDILNDQPASDGTELPSSTDAPEPQDVITFWPSKPGASSDEMVSFTHKNLVAAISAQLTAVPSSERLSPADLFLPAVPLSASFPLVLTLAALYSNASVAFNPTGAASSDLPVLTAGITPTIIVASPQALRMIHAETSGKITTSPITRTVLGFQLRSLVRNGTMPRTTSFLARFTDNLKPRLGATPGKLRLIYSAESAGAGGPLLSERALNDLRIFTGARIIYALTGATVAGSVTQTALYDYRVQGDGAGSHFGAPLTSLEIFLRDCGVHRTSDDERLIEGDIVARGPAVATGEASLGVVGRIRVDNTLTYP